MLGSLSGAMVEVYYTGVVWHAWWCQGWSPSSAWVAQWCQGGNIKFSSARVRVRGVGVYDSSQGQSIRFRVTCIRLSGELLKTEETIISSIIVLTRTIDPLPSIIKVRRYKQYTYSSNVSLPCEPIISLKISCEHECRLQLHYVQLRTRRQGEETVQISQPSR